MHPKEGVNGNGEPTPAAAGGDRLPVLESATALAVSFAICRADKYATSLLGILPCITAIVVTLATLFPSHIGKLAFVQIAVHLLVIMGAGKVLGIEERLLLIASNANVGGPTTACGMATTEGWTGILAGILGIAIATFLGIGFGVFVLQCM